MASPQDLHDMAVAILAEGRGENKRGREAIAHVINNRFQIQKAQGSTVSEVVRQQLEFSGMRPNDPNRKEAQRLADQNAKIYQEAVQIAKDTLAGKTQDPTNGATFYHADYISKPSWAKAKSFSKSATIGQHVFYNAPTREITAKANRSLYPSSVIPNTSAAHSVAPIPTARPTPPAPGTVAAFPTPTPRPDTGNVSPQPVSPLMAYAPAPSSTTSNAVPKIIDPKTPTPKPQSSVPVPRPHPMSRPGTEIPGTPAIPSPSTVFMSNRAAGLPTRFQDQAQYNDVIAAVKRDRMQPVNPALVQDARMAVAAVYGSDHTVTAFSGGQDPFGTGYNRTDDDTTRHDRLPDKNFGNAVDVHITDAGGKRLTGDALAPLVQYWFANDIGSIGVPVAGSRSGVHLDYIGGKGRDYKTDEGPIWAYGGRLPKAVITAFENGRKGVLPDMQEPQNAIHVQQGYAGPLHEINAYSKNVPPTPDGRSLPAYQMNVKPQSHSSSQSYPTLPAAQVQAARARSAMETFGKVEPAFAGGANGGSAFSKPAPAPPMSGTQTGNVGSADNYKTMRDYTPIPQNASFDTPATRTAPKSPITYNHQPAPAPALETRTITEMVPTRVPVTKPAPTTSGGMTLDNVGEFAYGPSSMNVGQMNADAFGQSVPTPTPKPEQAFETVMQPVTREIQVPLPTPQPASVPSVPAAEQPEADNRGFLSKLLGLPSIPGYIKNSARVGGLVGGVPGMAAGAYAGYMGKQLGGALFGRTPSPTSPYQARGVKNPNKTVGIFNPARTNSAGTGNGSGGPYEGESWRNTSTGGVRTFNPSTRQYEDYGGSNAGNRSESQTTGSGGGGGCFITTAAVEVMGEADNGKTLTTLRWFRDNIMANHPEWAVDIVAYRHVAPIIVAQTRHDKDLYRHIYKKFLLPSAKAIEAKDYKRAYQLYKDMVMTMNKRVSIPH